MKQKNDDKNSIIAIEMRFFVRLGENIALFFYKITPLCNNSCLGFGTRRWTSELFIIYRKVIMIIECRYLHYADTTHKKGCDTIFLYYSTFKMVKITKN